ncbi:myo-inositol-1-phosphate synthase [Mayamaea pseudoterrestris]|nr:myo-inositol-1-phosphate synthase [Mayamaea pseudoterrestris]
MQGAMSQSPRKLPPSPRDAGSTGSNSTSSTANRRLFTQPPSPNHIKNRTPSEDTLSDSTYSAVSVTSSYRHHNFPFATQTPAKPEPVLVKDSNHKPKTTGSFGVLVIGLGGANGTTMLAGILANRRNLEWRGPYGEHRSANYYGCLTQLNQRGIHGGVGYKDRVKGLANANMAAIGGWDIRPAKPGDALLEAQILDYDLVRQVQDEMNKTKVFRGIYNPLFIGDSQHATATHVISKQEAPTDSEALKCLRADIRYFKWRNGVVGHTTVIWSASVEPNCDLLPNYETADDLLEAIEMTEEERGGPLPPSVLYATAALLEGCSFINGGSQNTVSCPGLADLAMQQTGVYCLGTDFKAGQTKFKTAAVEYLRTMGLKPRVIASSNHLGNNDMRNIGSASSNIGTAKLRVKHDIFAPWQEDELDHKVSIMFTEFINDDKRDFVEYTSLAFLGQPHTMVTYTRASDSVLCVPLMIDGAVWCDFFSSRSWPYERVAKALAYLFKVPEGSAKGVDPGFFRQMQELEVQVLAAHEAKRGSLKREGSIKKRVRIRPDEKVAEWAIPHDARIVCAGLACVDMQLNAATGGDGGEAIETFAGETSIGGGSVSMACKTLARLCHGAALDDGYMQITPPVVSAVVPLCMVGTDSTGDKLIGLLEDCGAACRNVETRFIKASRSSDPNARTALSILPIYQDGRRGCFFDAASNVTFSAREMTRLISNLSAGSTNPELDMSHMSADDVDNYQADLEQMTPIYGGFVFGYPHLMPKMAGEALAQILLEARSIMIEGGIVTIDLNGVPLGSFPVRDGLRSAGSLKLDSVIGPALEHVDILHMNQEELCLLTGCHIEGTADSSREDDFIIAQAINLFLRCGVAVVAVTRGQQGSFVVCNDADRFKQSRALPASWIDCNAKVGCVQLPKNTSINTNGAGDAFTAGLLVAAMLRHTGLTMPSDISPSVVSSPRAPPASSLTRKETIPASGKSKPDKKLTPYSLFMREHYISLKKKCNDDKKAIFSTCHEMWENLTEHERDLYERKAADENEDTGKPDAVALSVLTDINVLDSTDPKHAPSPRESDTPRSMYMTNRSLTLESAVTFASLVAAYHVDESTRNRQHIDMSKLIERATVVPKGLEEI